jgi:hypothetical protein
MKLQLREEAKELCSGPVHTYPDTFENGGFSRIVFARPYVNAKIEEM